MSFYRSSLAGLCCLSACSHPTATSAVSSAPPPRATGATASTAAATAAGSATAAAAASAAPPAIERPSRLKLAQLTAEPFALPGATPPVSLDYIFLEPERSRIWVPAGGTGSVAIFDIASRDFARVDGFKTAEREAHGQKRLVGPSSGAIGQGFAYVGDRASQEICAIELKSLKKGACLKLQAQPDGVDYVASTHEVWVTVPSSQLLVVLDASSKGQLKPKATIKLDGDPEGYALDEPHGLFLTNLEDKGSTLRIDLKTHAVKDIWNAGCSADGPRGIAVDSARNLVLVACTDHVQALDAAHAGARLGRLDTGAGLDNVDYVARTGLLYAAAGKAARLTVAHVEDGGQLTPIATGETNACARNPVADANGNVYVAEPQGARLLLFRAPESH
jgi:hypothetical protein